MNDIVIHAEGLTKYFGTYPALDHLDLAIPRGCVYGLLGRNGAGKSTAIKLMLGFLHPTAGTSSVFGCDSGRITSEIRQRIGFVAEGHRLYRWMSIRELENFQKAFFPDRWDSQFFKEMLDYFELSGKQKAKTLSCGQLAQVSLALSLAPSPELLIMDDPTIGLDPAIRRQFLHGIIHLIQHQGRTVLFSSHILSDVERIADRIAIIDKGRLRADCHIDEFRRSLRQVVFSYESSPQSETDIFGLVSRTVSGNDLSVFVAGTTDLQLEDFARATNAKSYRTIPMSIEDQFIAYTEPVRSGVAFRWEVNQ